MFLWGDMSPDTSALCTEASAISEPRQLQQSGYATADKAQHTRLNHAVSVVALSLLFHFLGNGSLHKEERTQERTHLMVSVFFYSRKILCIFVI